MRAREAGLWALSWGSAVVVCAALGGLLSFLLARGVPTLGPALLFGSTPPMEAILALKPVWDGIWPAMLGTLSLLAVTMALALVPGVGCGIYLACYAPPRKKQALETAVDVLAGFPSGLTAKFEALPFRIYYTAAQYADQDELTRAFGTALVLLALSALLSLAAYCLQRRLERRWRRGGAS